MGLTNRRAATAAVAAAVVAAALALGGCAGGDPTAAPAGGASPVPTSPSATTPSAPEPGPARTQTPPAATPPAGPRTTPPEARDLAPTARLGTGSTITVIGQVRPGVEAGCVAIETSQGMFTLVGERAEVSALKPGAQVVVTGRLEKGLLSVCQEGRPLRVLSVRPR